MSERNEKSPSPDSSLISHHSTLVVGVDVVEVGRVRRVLARHGRRFLDRVYTERELDYCQGRVASLAARFAGKEAIAKALGTGIGQVAWQDIEILPDQQGKPLVQLHGRAQQIFEALQLGGLAISLAHTREHAVAFVVGQRS